MKYFGFHRVKQFIDPGRTEFQILCKFQYAMAEKRKLYASGTHIYDQGTFVNQIVKIGFLHGNGFII